MEPEIHLISDGKLPVGPFIEKAEAVHHLVDYIHLREKHCSARELMTAVEDLLKAGIPPYKVIINDRIDVAIAVGAGGAQLAWHSLSPFEARLIAPHLHLGRSIHAPEEAIGAFAQGADYCLFGHVFSTASKPGLPERGLVLLAQAVQLSLVPVIAIGGIEPWNAAQIIQQGAAGIAVMSGICGAEDPLSAVMAYRSALHDAIQSI